MRVEFFLEGDPPRATAQERKVRVSGGRPMMYDPDSVLMARQVLCLWLSQHKPVRPLTGPVRLECHWMFRARSARPGTWKYTRPDVDNLMKLMQDCMTKTGFWEDDSQIVDLRVTKSWQSVPGIRVTIEELGGTYESR